MRTFVELRLGFHSLGIYASRNTSNLQLFRRCPRRKTIHRGCQEAVSNGGRCLFAHIYDSTVLLLHGIIKGILSHKVRFSPIFFPFQCSL